MVTTYTVTQLAELEGVSRTTMSQRVNSGDPRYIPHEVSVNSRAKSGVSVVYTRVVDELDAIDNELIFDYVRLAINKAQE